MKGDHETGVGQGRRETMSGGSIRLAKPLLCNRSETLIRSAGVHKGEFSMSLLAIGFIGWRTIDPIVLCLLPDHTARALVLVDEGLAVTSRSMMGLLAATSRKVDEGVEWLTEDLPLGDLPEDEF